MKLIHLSDLHIGKRVYEFSMLEDQKYILNRILEIVKSEQPDCVLIAGDVYDKPVPPAEAVRIFDEFLTSLAGLKTAVVLVSGNHDSAERLAFGANLMSSRQVYFSPVYDGTTRQVSFWDSYGEVCVHLLPFVKPVTVRHALKMDRDEDSAEAEACEKKTGDDRIETWQDALEAAVRHMEICPGKRNVLVAHQFVTGAQRCESEDIQAGGLDQVDVSVFDAFDYVALGHLHSPQHVGRETVRYCGTPLKYSFSETAQEKSVTVVELLEKGTAKIRTIPLVPLRDMRKIRGTYLELTSRAFYQGTNTDDYIQATLTDDEDIPDCMQKLRIIYPNLMHMEYDNKRTRNIRSLEAAENVEQKSELELFEEFYELQNNQPMSGQQKDFSESLLRKLCGSD